MLQLIRFLLQFVFWPLALFVPKIQQRLGFEFLNFKYGQWHLHPYADMCFEISSEGELEQVRPLIQLYLKQGKIIELIHASPSVERKVVDLYQAYPKQIYFLRLGLLTYIPFFLHFWIKAPVLVLCRYDFFPELVLQPRRLILLSATLKNWNNYSALKKFYYHRSFEFFHLIVTATETDIERFSNLGIKTKLLCFDFRVPQIYQRILQFDKKIQHSSGLNTLIRLVQQYPFSKRFILGSFWESELSLFSNEKLKSDILKNEIIVVIAPHILKDRSLENLAHELKQRHGLDSIIVKNETVDLSRAKGRVIISGISGILCEFYQYFGHAFVGGGHGRSVHSLLEPFISVPQLYCGPKIHRSTEYDLIAEFDPRALKLVQHLKDWYTISIEERLDHADEVLARRRDWAIRLNTELPLIAQKVFDA